MQLNCLARRPLCRSVKNNSGDRDSGSNPVWPLQEDRPPLTWGRHRSPHSLHGIVEQNLVASIIRAHGNVLFFFHRPLAAVLGVLAILVWTAPLVLWAARSLARASGLVGAARDVDDLPGHGAGPVARQGHETLAPSAGYRGGRGALGLMVCQLSLGSVVSISPVPTTDAYTVGSFPLP